MIHTTKMVNHAVTKISSPPLFSILLRTRTVHSEVSFIIVLFSIIYASLFFAVRFVVTFEKLAKTFQFFKAALQDHISISF